MSFISNICKGIIPTSGINARINKTQVPKQEESAFAAKSYQASDLTQKEAYILSDIERMACIPED